MRSFYQDRLGGNVGKAQTRLPFPQAHDTASPFFLYWVHFIDIRKSRTILSSPFLTFPKRKETLA